MKDRAIFLSASVPELPKKGETERLGSNDVRPLEIRDAVLALVAVATKSHELVFGGHPAISPLVEHAARNLGTTERVHIFQSRFFEGMIPPEAKRFDNLHWTDRRDDIPSSLDLMRREMLGFRAYCAGFFIGGMEGIREERNLFAEMHPVAPIHLIASTGGATTILWKEMRNNVETDLYGALATEKRYAKLFRSLLSL